MQTVQLKTKQQHNEEHGLSVVSGCTLEFVRTIQFTGCLEPGHNCPAIIHTPRCRLLSAVQPPPKFSTPRCRLLPAVRLGMCIILLLKGVCEVQNLFDH